MRFTTVLQSGQISRGRPNTSYQIDSPNAGYNLSITLSLEIVIYNKAKDLIKIIKRREINGINKKKTL